MQFLRIYWWFFLEVCRIVGFSCLWQSHVQLIDLRSIIVDFSAPRHVDHTTCCEALHIMGLSIPQFSFNRAGLVLKDEG